VNPGQWLHAKLKSSPHGYPVGYSRVLLFAVYLFHRVGQADEAKQHLLDQVTRHSLKNSSRIRGIVRDLDLYLNWAARSRVITADTRVRIRFNEGGDLELRGEISRVDFTKGGYRATLLAAPPQNWQKQLRMPLVQRAIAETYGRPVGEVEVGFQCLDGSSLTSVSSLLKNSDSCDFSESDSSHQ